MRHIGVMVSHLFNKSINETVMYLIEKVHTLSICPRWLSLFIENSLAFIKRRDVRFRLDKDLGLFVAYDHKYKRYFVNRKRGFWLYRRGLGWRKDFIFSSYCLDSINFKENDVCIDCGANSGDLYLRVSDHISPRNYIAIEPNPSDFSVLTLNLPEDVNLINKALGSTNAILKFYVSTTGGDSSLIEPPRYDEIIDVDVVRLDSLTVHLGLGNIKLLKIEAEGYEPEVLDGCGEKLNQIEYVAIDAGPERGKNREQTLTSVTNHLLKSGFEMVDIYLPWHRALFRNTNMTSKSL